MNIRLGEVGAVEVDVGVAVGAMGRGDGRGDVRSKGRWEMDLRVGRWKGVMEVAEIKRGDGSGKCGKFTISIRFI